jgi:hypothetical protein
LQIKQQLSQTENPSSQILQSRCHYLCRLHGSHPVEFLQIKSMPTLLATCISLS